MSRRVYIVETHKDHSGWWVIFVAAIFVAYGKELLALAAVVVVCWLVLKFAESRKAINDLIEVDRAALAQRADNQNKLANMGDPAGVYGDYTPPTMPITDRMGGLR